MASPFRIFRKYQKAMLAIAAVLAMVIFVFADLFTSSFSSSGGNSAPDINVTSWEGGSLKSNELDYLVQRRLFIGQFVAAIYQQGGMKLVEAGITPQDPQVPNFALPSQLSEAQIRQIYIQCVYTRVFSELAEEAGISVSDKQINRYLKEISFNKLKNPEIIGLLPGNRAHAENRLFKGIRELLLSDIYLSSFFSNLGSITPEQRWQDWKKINERISVEAAVLPISRFTSKVQDPTEAELGEFFDLYKDQNSDVEHFVQGRKMPSPTPGFREPRRIKVQYLFGDVSSRTLEYLDSISEQEILDFYDRNKRTLYVDFESNSNEKSSSEEEGDQESNPMDKSNDVILESDLSEADSSEAEENPTTEADSIDSVNQELKESSEKSNSAEASEGNMETESALEEPSELDTLQNSSGGISLSPFRLVALQNASASEGNAGEENDEALENENEEVENTDVNAMDSDGEPLESEEIRYVPLEKVREEIIQRLAAEKAVLELEPMIEKAMARLEQAYRDNIEEFAKAEEEGIAPAEPKFVKDLNTLAEELNLTHETPELLTGKQMGDTSWGKATDSQNRSVSVVRACFGDLSLFEPFVARDIDGNWYIVLKVIDQPSFVPELEEIRENIVDSWKKEKAAQLALEEAEQLAKKLEESADSMEVFFAGKPYRVETTDMFSWLSFGSTPTPVDFREPQLGEAPPLEWAGTDFMTEAFSLGESEAKAVLNYDKSSAFVIRVAEREQTEDELRKQFVEEAVSPSVSNYILLQMRQKSANQEVLNNLLDRVGFDKEALEAFVMNKVQ